MPGGLAELASLGSIRPACLSRYRLPQDEAAGPRRCSLAARDVECVRRTTLHAALASRAKEQDAQWVSARITQCEQDADGVTAAGIRAKWLIAADGLHRRCAAPSASTP